METKKCSKCGLTKHVEHFHIRKASKDGYTARCGKCINTKSLKTRIERPNQTRENNLKNRFNMSIEEYNVIFLKQRGRCAICSKPESNSDSKGNVKWLSVDHNHNTGDIRGLLCSSCNTGIGLLGDSVDTMKKAIKYLKERGSYGEK